MHNGEIAEVLNRKEALSVKEKTYYKMSLSRQGHLITLGEAINCAKTFNVDADLFLPGLIIS
ncbi:hypothetical protein [Candidatus Protochlamydia amoebophila]|uniref:Uncharacterized protein n=1 Tax=Candidatus Protochlamydia amoebophila TaxID=362787 RepID=A0A0C1HCJ5_9BACT|nr:hypothetical protein [Candidatus Protochlamydia amoebophila]KIC72518.1 hypothetical protein DB44_CG00070 [Candidatus Protochlamydia amoebophila]